MKLQKMSCPSCNGMLDIDVKDNEYIFCPYCGEKFLVDDGKQEYIINHNINKNVNVTKTVEYTSRTINEAEILKERLKREESKSANIMLLVIMGIFFVMALAIFLGLHISEKVEENKVQEALEAGKISAGYYVDYEEQDYEAVVTQFETLGFENITIVDLDDSGLAVWKNGKVDSISINGNASFDSNDYFNPDEPVIIKYH